MTDKIKLGYCVSKKYQKKLGFETFEESCRLRGFEATSLDLKLSLEEQGPFDIILHNVSDNILPKVDIGDIEAIKQLQNLETYLLNHPDVVCVDPLEYVKPVSNRHSMFTLLRQTDLVQKGEKVFVPNFVELKEETKADNLFIMEKAGVNFPCICKPLDAMNHDHSLVYHAEGLQDVPLPCVVQSFINHDAIMHKIHYVGDRYFPSERPSVKNLTKGDQCTETFHTLDVCVPESTTHLNVKINDRESECFKPDKDLLKHIYVSLRQTLHLDLLGIDLFIEKGTGKYAIIDINPFPGYEGISNIHNHILDLLIQRLNTKKKECSDWTKRKDT